MTEETFSFDTAVAMGLAATLVGLTADAIDIDDDATLNAAKALALTTGMDLDVCFGMLLAMVTVAAQSAWTSEDLRKAADALSAQAEGEVNNGKD